MCGQDVIMKPVRLPGRIGVDAGTIAPGCRPAGFLRVAVHRT
jgi:hypothetical protein